MSLVELDDVFTCGCVASEAHGRDEPLVAEHELERPTDEYHCDHDLRREGGHERQRHERLHHHQPAGQQPGAQRQAWLGLFFTRHVPI